MIIEEYKKERIWKKNFFEKSKKLQKSRITKNVDRHTISTHLFEIMSPGTEILILIC